MISLKVQSHDGFSKGGHSKLEFVCDMCICGFYRETFPSGCLALDYALGGGLLKGHIVEVCSYLVPWCFWTVHCHCDYSSEVVCFR